MISSIFGGGHKESDAGLARGRRDLATGDTESSKGVGGRTQMNLSPTMSGPPADARLVPHELITRLRSYHRLRALVLAYLRVQSRREWLGRRLTSLQKAGSEPDVDFWEEFQSEFSGMGLRSDFPSRLLTGDDAIAELVEKVDKFDGGYASVVTAADAALNPNQSSKSAQEAGEHVRAMLRLGREIAEKCQEQTYTLLDELYETVTEIFAGEERTSPVEDLDQDGRFSNKQVSSAGETPDVSGHQLFSSKGAR